MTTTNAAADPNILYGTQGVAAMAADTGGVGTASPPSPQTEGGTPAPVSPPVVESGVVVPLPTDSTTSLIPPQADTAAATGADKASSGGGADSKPSEEGQVTEWEQAPSAPAPAFTVDSYADLTVPEGITLDPAALADFKKLAAESNIDPAKAPALLDLYKTQLTRQLEAYQEQVRVQHENWAKQLDTIPEFKGERRAEAQATIGKALDQFGSPEVRQLISDYGLSNNPALGLFIYKLATGLQEGRMLSGGQPTSRDQSGKARGQSPGSILYPNQTQ